MIKFLITISVHKNGHSTPNNAGSICNVLIVLHLAKATYALYIHRKNKPCILLQFNRTYKYFSFHLLILRVSIKCIFEFYTVNNFTCVVQELKNADLLQCILRFCKQYKLVYGPVKTIWA